MCLAPLRAASNFYRSLEMYTTSSGILVVATHFSLQDLASFVLVTEVLHLACWRILGFGGVVRFAQEASYAHQHVEAVEGQLLASPSPEGRRPVVTGNCCNCMTSMRGGRRRQRTLKESRRRIEKDLYYG